MLQEIVQQLRSKMKKLKKKKTSHPKTTSKPWTLKVALTPYLLRDSTLCSCFISSDQEEISQHLPGQRIWKSVRINLLMFQGKLVSIRKCVLVQPTLTWNHCDRFPYPDRFPCTRSSDLEMTWTSSFLVQSDKLVIVLHLLLSPAGAVVKSAEHEVVRHRSPVPVTSRCFLPSHGLKVETTGCRTKIWHDPQVQWSDRLLWGACSPEYQQSGCRRSDGSSAEAPPWGGSGSSQWIKDRGTRTGEDGVQVLGVNSVKAWDKARRDEVWMFCEAQPLMTWAIRVRDVCTQSCATTVHEKMWRAAGVSVFSGRQWWPAT